MADAPARLLAPCWDHPFGTDELRRDLLARRHGHAGFGPAVGLVVEGHVAGRVLRQICHVQTDQEVLADGLHADELEEDVVAVKGPQGVRIPLDHRLLRGRRDLFFPGRLRRRGWRDRAAWVMLGTGAGRGDAMTDMLDRTVLDTAARIRSGQIPTESDT